MRRAEWLARPWRLMVVVLLLVAMPLLAFGELVTLDARSRLEQAERRATEDAARRAAELVAARLTALGDEVFGITRSAELSSAVRTGDPMVVQGLLTTYRTALSADIERMLVIAVFGGGFGSAPSATRGEVVAQFPTAVTVPDVNDYVPMGIGNFAWARSTRVVTHTAHPAGIVLSEGIRFVGPPTPGVSVGNWGFAAEVPLGRVARWLTPMLSAAREIHLVDERRRLIASATADGAVETLRIIKEPVELAGAGDLVAVAELPNVTWKAVALREPAAVIAFDEAAGVQRGVRLALVALILASAFVIGSVASQLRRERQDLRVANARLDAASEAKSRFLAAVSHDLRTPLNAILGFSDLLLQRLFGEINEKQEEYLRDIRGAGEHQLSLVNDLLDLSKIEAGKMELHPVPLSLRELLHQTQSVVLPLAEAKHVRLELDVPPDLPPVEQDPARLRQVVLNLLSNAVKFTPEGGSVRTAAAFHDGRVTVAVSDTGVGISAEDQARVFEEFQQVGASARSGQGTGLGLALVRGFVRMMGGEVSLRSAVGQGSTFTITLPQRQTATV